ncbi:MAG: FkbM family methyltransferase [Acetobacteraceae bacterium]|nr:FkbM family methyltransferase [Acetobacteraceae bacterium]
MQAAHRLDIVTTAELRALGDRRAAEGLIRGRCMVVPLDATTALCRVLGRYKMYVDLRDVGFVPHLMFEGYWEYWITDFVWRNIAPGQVAVDVGANHGYYTLLLADLVGAEGRVHALEPNPRLAELTAQTVMLNGFAATTRLHAAAAGEATGGTLPLVVPLRDPKNGFVVERGGLPAGLDPSLYDTHQVPVMRLDDAVEGAVNFVKIDVEGAEEGVWRGMQGLIARSPGIAVLMEFNPHRCRDPQATLLDIARRFPLREVGYDGLAAEVTAAQVLARREDTMLYLSERDPV